MFGRTLGFALAALCIGLVPAASAFADTTTSAPTTAAPTTPAKVKQAKAAAFPMALEKFKKHTEKRLAKEREKIVARMTSHKVDADRQKVTLDRYDSDSKQIMEAAGKAAGTDGMVTKEKADSIRTLGKTLRTKARTDLKASKPAKKS